MNHIWILVLLFNNSRLYHSHNIGRWLIWCLPLQLTFMSLSKRWDPHVRVCYGTLIVSLYFWRLVWQNMAIIYTLSIRLILLFLFLDICTHFETLNYILLLSFLLFLQDKVYVHRWWLFFWNIFRHFCTVLKWLWLLVRNIYRRRNFKGLCQLVFLETKHVLLLSLGLLFCVICHILFNAFEIHNIISVYNLLILRIRFC